jgi:hypothetical protein
VWPAQGEVHGGARARAGQLAHTCIATSNNINFKKVPTYKNNNVTATLPFAHSSMDIAFVSYSCHLPNALEYEYLSLGMHVASRQQPASSQPAGCWLHGQTAMLALACMAAR